VWRIDTKYFSVDVRVCCAGVPGDVVLDGAPCEGVILVFDVADERSFEHLQSWDPFLEEHGVEVRVCAHTDTRTHTHVHTHTCTHTHPHVLTPTHMHMHAQFGAAKIQPCTQQVAQT
jgi:hypothetical protein